MLDIEEVVDAAENGEPEAQNLLGHIYLYGDEQLGIEKNLCKAEKYLLGAAQNGSIPAMVLLGEVYCFGEHGLDDYEHGMQLLMQAAEAGDSTALGDIGFIFCKGIGTVPDMQKGFAYFLQAAEKGNAAAMHVVAGMYKNGEGTEADFSKLNFWEQKSVLHRQFDEVYPKIKSYSNKGNTVLEEANFDYAEQCFQDALELIPEPKNEFSATTWLYAALGDVYYQQGAYTAALDAFMGAYNGSEGYYNPYVVYMLGKIYYELGVMNKAKEFLTMAYMVAGEDIFLEDDGKYLEMVEK